MGADAWNDIDLSEDGGDGEDGRDHGRTDGKSIARFIKPEVTRFFPNAQQGFPFHSGGFGVEDVFARRCVCACNLQPFATVRNCSQVSA